MNEEETDEADKFHRVAVEFFSNSMQLKLFVVPIKNVPEAEAEMNGFLRGPKGSVMFYCTFAERTAATCRRDPRH